MICTDSACVLKPNVIFFSVFFPLGREFGTLSWKKIFPSPVYKPLLSLLYLFSDCWKSKQRGSRTRGCAVWNFSISLSSQSVYPSFHILPTSLKIFQFKGLPKFLCLFSCCQIKAELPKKFFQHLRFPTLGTCAERANGCPTGSNLVV